MGTVGEFSSSFAADLLICIAWAKRLADPVPFVNDNGYAETKASVYPLIWSRDPSRLLRIQPEMVNCHSSNQAAGFFGGMKNSTLCFQQVSLWRMLVSLSLA